MPNLIRFLGPAGDDVSCCSALRATEAPTQAAAEKKDRRFNIKFCFRFWFESSSPSTTFNLEKGKSPNRDRISAEQGHSCPQQLRRGPAYSMFAEAARAFRRCCGQECPRSATQNEH